MNIVNGSDMDGGIPSDVLSRDDMLQGVIVSLAGGLIACDNNLMIVAANSQAALLLDVPPDIIERGRS